MNIYHYTTLEASLNILQKNNICFWGTRYDSMNDPTDYVYARDIVIPLFKKEVNESNLNHYETDDSEAYPYIVSFSKIEDDFNMWRMYKADVALEFNRDLIDEIIDKDTGPSFIYFRDCEYPHNNDEIHEFFVNKLNSINEGQGMMLAARHAVTFIKRKEFENEKEVRLVKFDHEGVLFNEGIAKECEIPNNICVKCVRGKDLVLYKEFLLPKKTLVGIIINSSNEHFVKIKGHLEIWLHHLGYDHEIKIRKTNTGNLINI